MHTLRARARAALYRSRWLESLASYYDTVIFVVGFDARRQFRFIGSLIEQVNSFGCLLGRRSPLV